MKAVGAAAVNSQLTSMYFSDLMYLKNAKVKSKEKVFYFLQIDVCYIFSYFQGFPKESLGLKCFNNCPMVNV